MRVDIAMEKFDRVFDRDDIRETILVDVLNHRGERSGFAGAGDSRHENEAAGSHGDLRRDCRKVQFLDRTCLKRDYAKGVCDRSTPVSYTHLRAHETGRNLV